MKNNQVCKLFLLAAAIFFSLEAFAQNIPALVEKNLPEKIAQDQSGETAKTSQVQSGEALSSVENILPKKSDGNGLANLLLGKKPTSLMFDDEESNSIDRAIESLKNNQVYSPEDQEQAQEDEASKAKAELEKIQKEQESQENEKSYIYLASLMYFNSKDWVVWINEQKITSKNNGKEKELFVESVQKDQIKILWKLSVSKWKIISGKNSEDSVPKTNDNNQIEVRFSLKPNQTFILSTNAIVEGKALIAVMKKREDEKKILPESNPSSSSSKPSEVSKVSSLLKKSFIE